MSGFYEVTAASVDGGGRQIPGRARNGQSDHESSRRRPHPHEGFGYHRPMTAALRPTGSAPRSSPGAHKRTARQASSYTVRSRPPGFPGRFRTSRSRQAAEHVLKLLTITIAYSGWGSRRMAAAHRQAET